MGSGSQGPTPSCLLPPGLRGWAGHPQAPLRPDPCFFLGQEEGLRVTLGVKEKWAWDPGGTPV